MSGLGDPSGTRLIPMTKAQRDRLHLHGWRNESDAYDAAPADPAEAVSDACWTVLGGYVSPNHSQEVKDAVLAALGVLANPANEEHHA